MRDILLPIMRFSCYVQFYMIGINKKSSLFPLVIIAVIFCAAPTFSYAGDYTSLVNGTIHKASGIAKDMPVLLYIGETQGCLGQADAITGSEGKFSFTKKTEKHWADNLVVYVRYFSFCIRKNEKWVELWSILTGSPPQNITFNCTLSESSSNNCNVIWDGRTIVK